MDNTPQKKNYISDIIDYVELFVIAVCIVIILFSGILRVCTVDGTSMVQTLQDKEVLIVSDAFYTPKRGDIIVFHQTSDVQTQDKNKPLVKRVIGIEGDTVKIDYTTWTVTITDAHGETFTVEEDYKFLDPNRKDTFLGEDNEYTVPEGCLFVMGDNRRNSLDSRYAEIGYVDARRVLGKVIVRILPLQKFGTVN